MSGDAARGGQFLLQLLQKPPQQSPPALSESPSLDPAVAAVGPPLPFAPHAFFPQNPNPNSTGHVANVDGRFGNPRPGSPPASGSGQGLNRPDPRYQQSLQGGPDSIGFGNERSYRALVPPPGFVSNSGPGGNRSFREIDSNGTDGGGGRNRNYSYHAGVTTQLRPRSNPVPFRDIDESMMKLPSPEGQNMKESANHSQLVASLRLDDQTEGSNTRDKAKGSRDKDYRADKRGKWILGQRIRITKRNTTCRRDIDRLNAPFLAIYESLIPSKEEKEKQEKLLTLLRSLVKKNWPEAQLYVYGSCANSFGFSKSDIDICLVIQNMDINKSEVLLKLAETLESNNLQNVQALTRARVPIVKLMDPDTGISCDICINNILAVINTKLLHDYSRIDGRLRQLAFIVKHWAKTRGVNETYQGTLSSYAYVLMCINFLQQRTPAILPCLQGMDPTYSVTVEDTECAYFNEVDKLYGFGARNGETISHLVWAFFNYWAYYHDYTNDVISVRTGGTLSKQDKDWTRRIGNDRHLICIEDPFEITHDLGRVVDKASIRVLREEFERAAEIMQHDFDPCTKLFEPYVAH